MAGIPNPGTTWKELFELLRKLLLFSSIICLLISILGPGYAVAEPLNPETQEGPVWYLAEGSNNWGFSTVITILNPNPDQCTARVTYMTESGPVGRPDITLPASSITRLNTLQDLPDTDFSTRVECLDGKPLAVDRIMSWMGGPGPEADDWMDQHLSTGVTSPATNWYLAEGSSKWGFECWLLIQNPNNTDAACQVTYMIEGGAPVTVTKTVPPESRRSYNIADDIGAEDTSIQVECPIPVIPERAMYKNERREGHDSIGTTTPNNDYYLPEGCTAYGFTTYVLIQNPNNQAASVTITYMTPGGDIVQPTFSVPANSRDTVRINDSLPDKDVSTLVHADRPIIAERAMYWTSYSGEVCHDSIGVGEPHKTIYLPYGETSQNLLNGNPMLETWTLVQNPNDALVEIEISYLTDSGIGNPVFSDTLPANSRKTYNMADYLPGAKAGIVITSKTPGKNIMAERSFYTNAESGGLHRWTSGCCSIGAYSD